MAEAGDEAAPGADYAPARSRLGGETAAVGELDDHRARRVEALDDEVDVAVFLELHLDEPRADPVDGRLDAAPARRVMPGRAGRLLAAQRADGRWLDRVKVDPEPAPVLEGLDVPAFLAATRCVR